ncbi:hypothetical protein EKL33_20020, partial [Pseudomonas aeruginosa]
MAGGPTALTLIARTSATGAQPLSLRARFPRPRPPMDKIPLAAAAPARDTAGTGAAGGRGKDRRAG